MVNDLGPVQRAPVPRRSLSLALAAAAYDAGEVRLSGAGLRGASHLVATRRGLFAVSEGGHRLVAHGLYYGLTVGDGRVLAFEACDLPRADVSRGRVVELSLEGDRIAAARVVAAGLNTGCHQIDLIDGSLCVVDTHDQAVRRLAPGGGWETLRPLPPPSERFGDGYAHVNSLVAAGEAVLLMLHNGKAGRTSEVAVLDRDWRLARRHALPGGGCHNIAVLDDGSWLMCDSAVGGLVTSAGRRIPVGPYMTRGLSVDYEGVVVGGSPFASREARTDAEGVLWFLDRDYRIRSTLGLPGAPTEIRRIDGRDRSLSRFLGR